MSEIQRYSMMTTASDDYGATIESEIDSLGSWVKFSDHLAELTSLRSENARLRKALEEIGSRYPEYTRASILARQAVAGSDKCSRCGKDRYDHAWRNEGSGACIEFIEYCNSKE